MLVFAGAGRIDRAGWCHLLSCPDRLASQTSACTESCFKIMQGLYQSANSQHFNPCHRPNNKGLCAECAAEKGLPQQVPQRWLAGSIPAPSHPPGEQLQPH